MTLQSINQDNYADIFTGSSVMATGGGGSIERALELGKRLTEQTQVQVVQLDALDDDDMVGMAYSLGSTAHDHKDNEAAIKTSLHEYLERYDNKIDAIIPGEMGPTQLYAAIQAAAFLDIPIIDTDTESGRCVPELRMSLLRFDDHQESPVVVSDAEGKIITLEEVSSLDSLEEMLRGLTESLGLVGGFGHCRPICGVREHLRHGTVSEALTIGRRLRKNGYESLDGFRGMEMIGTGHITSIDEEESKSFYSATLVIEGDEEYRIYVKNEFLALETNEYLYKAPESISLIDTDTQQGIYTGEMQEGQHVAILRRPAQRFWKTDKGLALFQPVLKTVPFKEMCD